MFANTIPIPILSQTTSSIRSLAKISALLHIIFIMLDPNIAHARQFLIPGEEIWGRWKLIRYELRGLNYRPNEATYKILNENMGYLPIGQILEIYDDDFQYYFRSASNDGPYIVYPMVKVIFKAPFQKEICRNNIWKFKCPTPDDLSSNFNTDYEDRAYVMFDVYENQLPSARKIFPDLSVVTYKLLMEVTGDLYLQPVGRNHMIERIVIDDRTENARSPEFYIVWERIGAAKK